MLLSALDDAAHRVIGIRHTLRAFKNAGLVRPWTFYPQEAVEEIIDHFAAQLHREFEEIVWDLDEALRTGEVPRWLAHGQRRVQIGNAIRNIDIDVAPDLLRRIRARR